MTVGGARLCWMAGLARSLLSQLEARDAPAEGWKAQVPSQRYKPTAGETSFWGTVLEWRAGCMSRRIQRVRASAQAIILFSSASITMSPC
jgi:hypothetical protein